jgi:hypothetical protein
MVLTALSSLLQGPLRPTVLGELLAESTTRKCVIIILVVLIIATFVQPTTPEAATYDRVQLLSYGAARSCRSCRSCLALACLACSGALPLACSEVDAGR